MNDLKSKVYEFLKLQDKMVLASAADDSVNASILFFTVDPELNIYFMTKLGTQKARLMENQPNVSLVVLENNSLKALQAWGKVTPAGNPDDEVELLNDIIQKSSNAGYPWPVIDMMSTDNNQKKLFKIALNKIRFFDHPDDFETNETRASFIHELDL